MAVVAFRAETTFVRGCAKTYASQIGFSPKAEGELSGLGLFWPSVHQALRGGRVVWSDKEDANETKSIVVGTDCDGDRLRLTIRWSYPEYTLLVVSIERI